MFNKQIKATQKCESKAGKWLEETALNFWWLYYVKIENEMHTSGNFPKIRMQMEGQRKIKKWHSCKELLFALEHDYTRSD